MNTLHLKMVKMVNSMLRFFFFITSAFKNEKEHRELGGAGKLSSPIPLASLSSGFLLIRSVASRVWLVHTLAVHPFRAEPHASQQNLIP